MKPRIRVAVPLLCFLVAPTLSGQDTTITRATLRGLTGILVVVSPLTEDIQRDGLSQASIRTDVEIKLRLAGIRVLRDIEEALQTSGTPFLRIDISSLKSSDMHAVNFSVAVQQECRLYRELRLEVRCITWETESIAFVGSNRIAWLRDRIKDQVDRFINAYLSVNPKQ